MLRNSEALASKLLKIFLPWIFKEKLIAGLEHPLGMAGDHNKTVPKSAKSNLFNSLTISLDFSCPWSSSLEEQRYFLHQISFGETHSPLLA